MRSHFDPEQLHACQTAFEDAWAQVGPLCSARDHEWARDQIARAVIAFAEAGQEEPRLLALYAVTKGRALLVRATA